MPHLTWERIRPGVVNINQSQMVSNIVAVQLENPQDQAAMAQKIEAAVPDTELVIVPDCGHFIAAEAPDAFREAIVGFAG